MKTKISTRWEVRDDKSAIVNPSSPGPILSSKEAHRWKASLVSRMFDPVPLKVWRITTYRIDRTATQKPETGHFYLTSTEVGKATIMVVLGERLIEIRPLKAGAFRMGEHIPCEVKDLSGERG